MYATLKCICLCIISNSILLAQLAALYMSSLLLEKKNHTPQGFNPCKIRAAQSRRSLKSQQDKYKCATCKNMQKTSEVVWHTHRGITQLSLRLHCNPIFWAHPWLHQHMNSCFCSIVLYMKSSLCVCMSVIKCVLGLWTCGKTKVFPKASWLLKSLNFRASLTKECQRELK